MKIRITRAGVKTVARFVAARAVSTTLSLIIHKHADPETKLEIASVHIGAYVIGEWAGDAVKPFIDKEIDAAADAIESIRDKSKELDS